MSACRLDLAESHADLRFKEPLSKVKQSLILLAYLRFVQASGKGSEPDRFMRGWSRELALGGFNSREAT